VESADPAALAIAKSRNGPDAKPPGFHQVALLSLATATKAPPIPSARSPTASNGCAAAVDVPRVRRIVIATRK
jgi:hypothetical protein